MKIVFTMTALEMLRMVCEFLGALVLVCAVGVLLALGFGALTERPKGGDDE